MTAVGIGLLVLAALVVSLAFGLAIAAFINAGKGPRPRR